MANPSEAPLSGQDARLSHGRGPARRVSFRHRSTERELLDDFELQGDVLERSLRELERVNRWLGGHRLLRRALHRVLARLPARRPLRIVDVGSGAGDGSRALADFLRRSPISAELVGIDANPAAVSLARRRSVGYPEISFEVGDALGDALERLKPDIVVAALFCHHLTDEQLNQWLRACVDCGCRAIIVSDLQRHWLPYYLFLGLCAVLHPSAMTRHDGAISIKRGFTREELLHWAEQVGCSCTLNWCWAFRYQWILYP